MANFLDSDGPVDLYNCTIAIVWTTMWCLTFGLEVETAREILQDRMFHWFGLASAGTGFELKGGIGALGGVAYALPCLAVVLPRFLGTETAASRNARQVYGLWVWVGWIVFNLVALAKIVDGPYSGSPANYVWLVHNCFMFYCHYQWVGKDALAKLKMA